jgi:hypothetical protein
MGLQNQSFQGAAAGQHGYNAGATMTKAGRDSSIVAGLMMVAMVAARRAPTGVAPIAFRAERRLSQTQAVDLGTCIGRRVIGLCHYGGIEMHAAGRALNAAAPPIHGFFVQVKGGSALISIDLRTNVAR